MHASKRFFVLSLATILSAVSAFAQSVGTSIDRANQPMEETIRGREQENVAAPTSNPLEYFGEPVATPTASNSSSSNSGLGPQPDESHKDLRATSANVASGNSNNPAYLVTVPPPKPPVYNRDVYYRNKLEFSLNVGWHPINIPFPLDIFVGDAYNTYPLKYTLVPVFASLRWQLDGVKGPVVLRGNWDMTFTGSITGVAGDQRTGISLI